MYWNLDDKERLYQAFELADSRDLLINLLQDLLTEKEIEQCVLRLKVACLIHDGASYTEIMRIAKISPATIARLSRQLQEKGSGLLQIIKKFLLAGDGQSYFY
jgi:uncharacterized protein YerC